MAIPGDLYRGKIDLNHIFLLIRKHPNRFSLPNTVVV